MSLEVDKSKVPRSTSLCHFSTSGDDASMTTPHFCKTLWFVRARYGDVLTEGGRQKDEGLMTRLNGCRIAIIAMPL